MGEVGQQPELIHREKDVALALLAAERLLDGQIKQQRIDGGQRLAHAKIVLHKDHPAALLPHQLPHGEGAPLLEVADEQLPHLLLQLRQYALGLTRGVIVDVAGHGPQVRMLLQHLPQLGGGHGVHELAHGPVVTVEAALVAAEMGQHRTKQILGRIGEEGLGGILQSLGEQRLGDLVDGHLHVLARLQLVEEVPVVRPLRAAGRSVVADDHVARPIEGLVEVALGVKDNHHILVGHAPAQLADDLVKGIGLAGADTAQQHHVAAEELLVHPDIRSLPRCILPAQHAAGGARRVLHRQIVQGVAVKYFDLLQ